LPTAALNAWLCVIFITLVSTSYETTPKWHGFLMIKLAAFQAGWAEQRTAEQQNIE